jgi:plasmid maintenance system antidote protein VapI
MNKLILTLITLAFAPEILAIDMDYYAPNGMPTVAEAFQRLALIFSDTDYKMLFAAIALLGMMLAFANGFVVRPILEGLGKANGISWLMPFIIGTVIYTGGFLATATVYIYDPVKNDTQSVAGVPQVIVLTAGLANDLEKIMTDITDTASAYPYSQNADGVNLELFLGAIKKSWEPKKRYLSKDIQAFKEKCGDIVMGLPGASVNDEQLYSGATSQYSAISGWTHPSLTVELYNGTPGLNYMSCTDGWNNVLQPALQLSNFDTETEEICISAGFDITRAPQLIACQDLIGKAAELHGLSGMAANEYVREGFIANSLLKQINNSDPAEAQLSLARRQLTMQGIGALNTAEDTQPQLRSVMLSIVLGIIPFLTLFLVTPLWSKALKFMTGAILWIATWGVMMAVAHAGAMDSVSAILTDMASAKMGLKSFILAETDGVKALMMYGKIQSNSMMIAVAIAVAVYGFGSYAMTGLAQGLSQNMGMMGERAAEQTMTPEGRTQLRDQLTKGMASDGGVASAKMQDPLINQPNHITNTGSGWQQEVAAKNIGDQKGIAAATNERAGAIGSNIESVGSTATKTTTRGSLAGAAAQQITQDNVSSDGTALSGAANIAAANQGAVEGNVQKLQATNTNQDIRQTALEQSLAQGTTTTMTGSEILGNKDIEPHLQPGARDFLENNPNTAIPVQQTFDTNNNLTGFKVGQQQAVSIDKTFTQDKSSVEKEDNIISEQTNINTQTRLSPKDAVNLMQHNASDNISDIFNSKFDQAKQDVNIKTDDDKAVRDDIIDNFTHAFRDLSVSEGISDKSSVRNITGARGSVGGGIGISGSIYNDTSHTGETSSNENIQADITRANINNMYEESNTAEEFLDKVNNYYDEQRTEALNLQEKSDLGKSEQKEEKQKAQQRFDENIGDIGGA